MDALVEIDIFGIYRTLRREDPRDWRWQLELTCGEISLDASGYTQFFRRRPILWSHQQLGLGGVSCEDCI